MVRHVGFAQAYSFKYSPRPGTPAASIEGQIPEEVRADRLARLQVALSEQHLNFNLSCVRRTLPVLIEKVGRQPGQMIGRSPYLQAVSVPVDTSLLGQIVDVEIVGAGPSSLSGVIKMRQGAARPALIGA